MTTLAIDIETYSSIDLKNSGVYRYTEAPDFAILMLAFSYNNSPVQIIDLTPSEMDAYDRILLDEILEDLINPDVLKTAFNASFERTCLAKYFNLVLPSAQWECTMIKACMLGLPFKLETVARILNLPEQKSDTGKALIKYFSIPCKPTKVNGQRTRNLPVHAPEKYREFMDYCVQDVKTELSIRDAISFFEIPETEKQVWRLDQKINDNGIMVDRYFVNTAIALDDESKQKLYTEATQLTGLTNPNSRAQLISWLNEEMPLDLVEKLRKTDLPEIIKNSVGYTNEANIRRVIAIRQEMAKTSLTKYGKMISGVCSDDRLRGLHQYYGANRTGRWAGRFVQPQNLRKNELPDLDLARILTREGDLGVIELIFGNVPDVLSQLIRTAFIAPENSKFIMADYSAIEARVIAWLADERWRLDVFATHGKIYEASAAQMFNIPLESVTKTSPYRAKGKIAELALGYQGGPNALIKMDAKKELKKEELPNLVSAWRQANKRIVKLWYEVQDCAITAVRENTTTKLKGKQVYFKVRNQILYITLPSGRELCYIRPRLQMGKFDRDVLVYEGLNQTTKQWGRQDTYGGKLVENIVQAIARDCLATAMLRLDEANFNIVMHVHDEVILQEPESTQAAEVDRIMGLPMPWAPGLPLTAESTENRYYRKD